MKNIFRKIFLVAIGFSLISFVSSTSYSKKKFVPGKTYTIKGEVLWKGVKPVVTPIGTAAYEGVCGKVRARTPLRLKTERLWHKKILDAVVWLEPVWQDMTMEEIENLGQTPRPREYGSYEVRQVGCEFFPRISVVPVGSQVGVVNQDRKDHWFVIQGLYKKREGYVELYENDPPVFVFETPRVRHLPLGVPVYFKADKVDTWRLSSGFHRWMNGYVVITDKTWYGSVDEGGEFKIDGVPPGVYEIHSWHPFLGYSSTVIRVPEDIHDKAEIEYAEMPEFPEEINSTVISATKERWYKGNVSKEIFRW